ncbi:lysophospholipase L1-like esterase [Kribbella amoyensis]|uniref:Lysophospholipase L1-like esterase n=1 Tax=Kribbella amoyensis TaxID=996641 RepID=A0A561BV27_9ACTN|nr:SGNH/GDSL hydrolase family protein [Kribbella amoyensis]TWD82697.1 lysophospholipase L1-like esterase [Kribbella amoyensis]
MLFQGDSITHGGRGPTEDPNHVLGHSYPFLIAADAAARYPAMRWRFVNRGVSGDSVADLAARWPADAVDLRPDVLSILVGINDVNQIMNGASDDVDGHRFRTTYEALLERTRAELPDVLLVLGEPFYLPTSPVLADRAKWADLVTGHAAIARELASEYGAVFVPYQRAMNVAVSRAPAEYWIWDGIHPTYAGQRVLADAWLEAFAGRA